MEFYAVRKPESEVNELYHHGIKGQKWGIRRFQNPDGTWKFAGLVRRKKMERSDDVKKQKQAETDERRAKKHEQKKQEALASGKASKIAKYRSELTDAEVEKAINRINMQTRMDQAIEAQKKVGTDRLNRITNTVKTTANNVVDVYDTGAAIANATGLLEKELPVIFKDQKRKGVTLFDRGLEQRVAKGTASTEERQQYDRDRSARSDRGTLSNRETAQYRQELERRERSNDITEADASRLSAMRARERERQRSIMTPRAEDYSREEADNRNRQAQVTSSNADRLRRMANAASDVYGENDSRTQELRSAQSAMMDAAAITQARAERYNAANPNVRSNMTSKAKRIVDRNVRSDAVYKRARTPEEREARDAELHRRAEEVDRALSGVRDIDMDALTSRYSDLANLGNETPGSITYRNRVQELKREGRGMAHKECNYDELYHHGIKGQKWGIRRFQKKDGTWTAKGKKHRESEENTQKKESVNSEEKKRKVAKTAAVIGGVALSAVAVGIAAKAYNDKRLRRQYADDFAFEHREAMKQAEQTALACRDRLRNVSMAQVPSRPTNISNKAGNLKDALSRIQNANIATDDALRRMNYINKRW